MGAPIRRVRAMTIEEKPLTDAATRDWPFAWMGMHPPPASRVAALPMNEEHRLRTLTRTEILDSLPEQAYDDLVALASQICETPIALISLVDRDRQWFKAKSGLQTSETHRDLSFCAHAILVPDEVFSIHDAQRDPRFADNPLVTGAPHIRFYAGASIVTDDGEALGTVCVIDHKPRTLDAAQKRGLQVLARQASSLLRARQHAVSATKRTRRQEVLTDEARLKHERGAELLDLVLRSGDLGMWDLHVTSGQWTINTREHQMLGLPEAEATAERIDWRDLIYPDDWPALEAALETHLATGSPYYEATIRMRHRAGHWIWVLSRAVVLHRNAAGRPIRIIGTHEDITERKEIQRKLHLLARTDALTGLVNRQHLEERMDEAMARARRANLPGALLRIDVDRFRSINETFGHAGGDAVLRQFAARLRSCVREIDLVARLSGDAFVVVLEGLASDGQACTVAAEILTGMNLPFRVGNNDVVVTTSIGITLFSGIGESIEAVIQRAGGALGAAQAAGRGQIRTA